MAADARGGHTGNMVATLARRFTAHGVEVHEHTTVLDLLLENGACVGALALDADGRTVAYRAGAVVLATGGAGQMFPVNTAPGEVTGDGYAMALRAGAQLVNMEFMQYMVRVIAGRPPDLGGPFWSLGPVIRDSAGEDVLRAALPAGVGAEDVYLQRTLHYPFSSRDHSKWLDIAIQRTIRSGRGTARGAVLVDFSRVDPASARPARPQHRPPAPRVAIGDPLIEVTHAAHAINGGIRVDEWGQSTVPGLFAVGETIAGPHGADRLGGGMLAACNVFGARAGPRAAEYARGIGRAPMTSELLAGTARPSASIQARDPHELAAGSTGPPLEGSGHAGRAAKRRRTRDDARRSPTPAGCPPRRARTSSLRGRRSTPSRRRTSSSSPRRWPGPRSCVERVAAVISGRTIPSGTTAGGS